MKPRLVAPVIGVVIMLLSVVEPVDAQAVHAHRATRRRTAVVVSHVVREDEQQKAAAANAASVEQSTAAQQSATAAQQSATAAQQSATAAQQSAAAQQQAAAAGSLPVGTVTAALPAGCATSVVGGAQYYHCGNDWYRGAFQGDNLVYMTTAPPQ